MIKKEFKSHRTIISNTLYLSIIQVVRLLTPFLAMLYVIKTIGADKFGEIVFAQSIAAFSFIIINFGLDIPYGTIILKSVALMCGIPTPNIDKIIYWGQKMMNKEYLIDGELIGKDIYESGIPNNYGINSMEDLLNLK